MNIPKYDSEAFTKSLRELQREIWEHTQRGTHRPQYIRLPPEILKEVFTPEERLRAFSHKELWQNLDPTQFPKLAKNLGEMALLDSAVSRIPTAHQIRHGDSTHIHVKEKSIHLVVTSPPYWNLKKYPKHPWQLGNFDDYGDFLYELLKVWKMCYEALFPGGRLVCIVGDVCLSRRKEKRHSVIPLHADIINQCRTLGFENLTPIIWHKITNQNTESKRSTSFLGKPYEPGAIVKNEIEYVLMLRKPGYRQVSPLVRKFSLIPQDDHHKMFRAIWSDISGASTVNHPAPFPREIAEQLIRMFSFVGDTVFDPFLGTGTTCAAAMRCGRDSIGIEIEEQYVKMAMERLGETLNR